MINNTKIRFSIIIPVYNNEQTIGRAIQSCIEQTFSAFELIVINDGSNDNSEAIISNYSTYENITILNNTSNRGVSYTRNRGIKIARGEYLCFLDADDYFTPNKLDLINTCLEKNPEIQFLFHPFAHTYHNISSATEVKKWNKFRLLLGNKIATPCVIIKNEHPLLFNERMHYMEDYDLWLRYSNEHHIYFINSALTILGRPVLSKGGVSNSKIKMRIGELSAYTHHCFHKPLLILTIPFFIALQMIKSIIKVPIR